MLNKLEDLNTLNTNHSPDRDNIEPKDSSPSRVGKIVKINPIPTSKFQPSVITVRKLPTTLKQSKTHANKDQDASLVATELSGREKKVAIIDKK